MFRKILEIIVIFLALAVVVVISALLSLKAVFPENKLKKLFCDGIRGYVSREANFASIKWGLNGITIGDAVISARPGFEKGTFLSAKKINYKPVFLPGKTAGFLTVDSPSALIEYFPESSGITATSGEQQGLTNTGYWAHYLPLSGLNVVNGEIIFKNEKSGNPEIAIKKIEINLKKAGAGEMLEGSLSAEASRGKEILAVAADALIDYRAGTVRFNNAKIQAGRAGSIAVSGFIKVNNMEYNFNVKGDRQALDRILEMLPGPVSEIQCGIKEKVDLDISAGGGKLKVKDNLYGR